MPDRPKLEVLLIPRTATEGALISFWAPVSQLQKVASGARFITVEVSIQLGQGLVDVQLDKYYILEIRYTPKGLHGQAISEEYGRHEEEQNEAAETIEELLNDEEENEPEGSDEEGQEEEPVRIVGPRRIEVVLKHKADLTREEERGVVMSMLPPEGHFHTAAIAVRPWLMDGTKLRPAATHYTAGVHSIRAILVFGGGAGGTITSLKFGPEAQVEAWAELERRYAELKQPERRIVQNWTPSFEGGTQRRTSATNPAGGRHHTQNLPHHYRPAPKHKAAFRVAGDEIGATIFREQSEAWDKQIRQGEANFGLTAKEVRKSNEKKDSAPDTDEDYLYEGYGVC